MLHGDIDSNILTVILCPKIRSKVRLFSAENGPTLNAVCDKTIDPISFRNQSAENTCSQVSKNTRHYSLAQTVSEIHAFL